MFSYFSNPPVILPPVLDVSAETVSVRVGGTAILRCLVSPETMRQHVQVTSWIQDDRNDIFPIASARGLNQI